MGWDRGQTGGVLFALADQISNRVRRSIGEIHVPINHLEMHATISPYILEFNSRE